MVRFQKAPHVATFLATNKATMMTYDLGADGHYFSKTDRKKAGLPIIRRSTKRVGFTNGGTSTGKYVTKLPFQHLSDQAAEADTFDDFSSSLLSVGKHQMMATFPFSRRKVSRCEILACQALSTILNVSYITIERAGRTGKIISLQL